MVEYNRDIIQKFAVKLYKKANSIVAVYAFLGLLLGGVGGFFLSESIGGEMGTVAITAIVVAILGIAVGLEKAFLLKMQAQTALCQMKIEQNTSGKIV